MECHPQEQNASHSMQMIARFSAGSGCVSLYQHHLNFIGAPKTFIGAQRSSSRIRAFLP